MVVSDGANPLHYEENQAKGRGDGDHLIAGNWADKSCSDGSSPWAGVYKLNSVFLGPSTVIEPPLLCMI